MIIPMWVDEKKDAGLIKWLNEQTNRSAFMRLVLYDRMKGVRVEREDKVEVDNDILNCIEGLGS